MATTSTVPNTSSVTPMGIIAGIAVVVAAVVWMGSTGRTRTIAGITILTILIIATVVYVGNRRKKKAKVLTINDIYPTQPGDTNVQASATGTTFYG